MHSSLNFNLLCVFFFLFFFQKQKETIQHKLVRSALRVVFHANCKELNCCEKWPVHAVTPHAHRFELINWTVRCCCSSLTINIFRSLPSEAVLNRIVLKESTLTYITMLINRTFPFCRRPQRTTLSVSVAESPYSLGPHSCFSHVAIYSLN